MTLVLGTPSRPSDIEQEAAAGSNKTSSTEQRFSIGLPSDKARKDGEKMVRRATPRTGQIEGNLSGDFLNIELANLCHCVREERSGHGALFVGLVGFIFFIILHSTPLT